ncbi:TRM11 family methyltransferase [Methanolobus profundi]|uniref:site-specific DNA-methyltransferase (cytosine-N(4)-specific) n=1 Tax=Methanolobus profundi TaxID=487685 RepID=A0A1I4QLG2_9EURY|nr:class I SAM-dependent methyltransferase [Methanolobus profundi]SFM40473.1 Methyltransferase domain-containing protein [Methanolobus profundi]
MMTISNVTETDFDSIPIDPFWNTGDEKELKMHKIHTYPAKFPAFIASKAFDYAKENSIEVNTVADVFCGCGTVAFEAKRSGIDFWGCDINPVATMIAKTKSHKYQVSRLQRYFDDIIDTYKTSIIEYNSYDYANERLKYWYDESHYGHLLRLKAAIESCTPAKGQYRSFFICAFSNILKPTSRWLTKSIKPQVDPDKEPSDVLEAFENQCSFMFAANEEIYSLNKTKTCIVKGNFLDNRIVKPEVDVIITSPPYVTSYEYADLHQLSSLWLGFAEDYRELRDGSIGSLHHVYDFDRELEYLNNVGAHIVTQLLTQYKSKAYSVAKYFLDMQQVAKNCHSMLSENGLAIFIIGNTEYKGVRIDNARHLAESLQNSGFNEILVTKRKISNKILTPYRDSKGRFTADGNGRKVYNEEFILVGKK